MTESDNATQNLSRSPYGLWSEIEGLRSLADTLIGGEMPMEVYNALTPEQKKITLNVTKACSQCATALEKFQEEVLNVGCPK
ncbi:Hypothetical protein BAMTRB_046 [Escherichia phage vB_Eco_Bam]|uniref:Uncharacterized protein n=1 Tax=Escherichia phage vB_Eco_Bam TaxID=2898833 RepID=A0A9P0VD11_9CAUD|nr:hypothetical protein MAK_045 [Escherichia phage vB_Eco_Mak]CAH7774619.1 hypothetical protein TITUS_043 [Escherichia phage vB_Eco_Titus]CAI9888969.1 Hypothetical protein BAMTRB_046 [Escherichia phage vB_Eco_Bam]